MELYDTLGNDLNDLSVFDNSTKMILKSESG